MKPVSKELILKLLNDVGSVKVDETQLNENLIDLGMDSIEYIQIVVKLEEVFECEIPDENLLITEMDTVQKMMNVLQELYDGWKYKESGQL